MSPDLGDIDGATVHVWWAGAVRVVKCKTAEMASAACEKLRARARREAPTSNIVTIKFTHILRYLPTHAYYRGGIRRQSNIYTTNTNVPA